MSIQEDVSRFLRTRRARVTPEQAGLVSYGGTRRVPGLRREEVALLAGVSVDQCARSASYRNRIPVNLARFLFLIDRAAGFFLDWAAVADDVVAALRGTVGRNADDRKLADLVGELSVASPE